MAKQKKTKRVKIPEALKIQLATKVIDLLIKVLNKTKEKYTKNKKSFNTLSDLKATELAEIEKIDSIVRQSDLLSDLDKNYIEIDISGKKPDGKGYNPSCDSVHDVLVYIREIVDVIIDL